ncbi:MAG: DUF1576 domain-containing protein [Lachnospiraceae bacterium]
MEETGRRRIFRGRILKVFCMLSAALLFVAAFLFDPPEEIAAGMQKIVFLRDALITDYFAQAGYGAAFFNAGLMMAISIALVEMTKIPYTGLTLGALFINTGFGFWGKNPVNIIPIILGTVLYAKLHHAPFGRYVYTALFATCLAPFVTEIIYLFPFSGHWNHVCAVLIGVFIGFAIPPLSMHTASMHMGYSLFNVGFSGGILAFVMFCVLKSFGLESEAVFIWKEGRHPWILAGTFLYFFGTFFLGLLTERGKISGMLKIMRHPGRAVADFVLMDGPGRTLMNMGIMGMIAELYVLAVGGDLSGPIIGCLLTVFGFSAFGAHPRNYLPVLAGVFFSTFLTKYTPDTPGILIASLFVVGLSPIAGQFGPIAGIIAGMLHSAVVMCTSQMYGGLNLYNNGFSAGWIAIIMVPTIESFMKQYEDRKRRKKLRPGKESKTNGS